MRRKLLDNFDSLYDANKINELYKFDIEEKNKKEINKKLERQLNDYNNDNDLSDYMIKINQEINKNTKNKEINSIIYTLYKTHDIILDNNNFNSDEKDIISFIIKNKLNACISNNKNFSNKINQEFFEKLPTIVIKSILWEFPNKDSNQEIKRMIEWKKEQEEQIKTLKRFINIEIDSELNYKTKIINLKFIYNYINKLNKKWELKWDIKQEIKIYIIQKFNNITQENLPNIIESSKDYIFHILKFWELSNTLQS